MLSAGRSANASAERGGYNAFPKTITAAAVAFLLVVCSFHLPVALVFGRDRLEPGRRPAAAAGAVVVAADDHRRSAFFLFRRVLHPQIPHPVPQYPVEQIRTAARRRLARVPLRP